MMKWNIYSERDVLEKHLVSQVVEIMVKEIERKAFATLLISGGSTPVGFFEKLSSVKLPWTKVSIALIDDRLNREYTNEILVRNKFLINEASQANFISLLPESSDGGEQLSIISERTKIFMESMDCVILGMGTDGHTASLFPGDPESNRAMEMKLSEGHLAYTNAPNEPVHRITFTLNAINKAKNVFLHIYGENKKLILTNKENKLPIASVLNSLTVKPQVYYSN